MWFEDTFLQSIFEKGRNVMLTAKQVNVCVQHMKPHEGSTETIFRSSRPSTWYSYQWKGRLVTVSAPYPNGCACMSFGNTEEEAKMQQEKAEKEREEKEEKRISRTKANPEKLEKRVQKLQSLLKDLEEELECDIEEGNEEDILIDRKEIEKVKCEIKKLTA